MSAHSIHLQDKRRKSPKIIRISYLEEIPADKNVFDSSMVNESSGFEPLKFYCTYENGIRKAT